RSPETCGDPSHSVPLYITELVNEKFFYTISVTDTSTIINVYDYILEGVAARVFITQELSTIPLFRLVTPGSRHNLYTTSTTERAASIASGQIDVGIVAYIYPSEICRSVPFYCLYESSATRHFYTTSLKDRDAILATDAWVDKGITGYVLNDNVCTSG
ncbi:hypothetical protein B0H14DRAFT_2334848, partial [Mycena olivaceomarginata]